MKIPNSIKYKKEIIKFYKLGDPIYFLAKKFHTSKDDVKKVLVDSGVEIRKKIIKRSILRGKEKEINKFYKNGKSLSFIANYFNCSLKTVRNIVCKSFVIRPIGFYTRSKKDFTYKSGYKMIPVQANYPKRFKSSYFYYEHILLVEKAIGRLLNSKEEHVHHIDLDKLNNNIDNLYLCSAKEHTKLHKQLNNVVSDLIKMNKIIFNRKKKKYEISI